MRAIQFILISVLFISGTKQDKGLKDYYKDYFPIGVAITPQSVRNEDERNLILRHFNSVTAENAMKMGPIHPRENEYYWKDADSIVAFAQRNKLRMRGHTLCWHNQTPDWFFKDSVGNNVSKELLLKRLKEHITTIVSRYKGKIYAWDVVNEAVDDNPNNFLRNSLFFQIAGEEYIEKAFEYAHAADPDAILFYNDYNTERKEKADRIYKLLKNLKDKGVPVHAVGLQAHWNVFGPTREEMEYSIAKFVSLGLKIQYTELDISIYRSENLRRDKTAGDIAVFTPELEQQQLEKYKTAFEVFRKYKQHISGITFWNISDRHSWLDNYPVRGRKNYPLLFDTTLRPKKAYDAVVQF